MENKNFIKVLDQDKANQLIALGFKYTTETMNGSIVHSFFVSEELLQYINKNFGKKDFFLNNKMTFKKGGSNGKNTNKILRKSQTN